ncbi:MAG: O-antigen ligase family protein [bacterium]|nr:O-antigen ligase family protein [bacterium]
MRIDRNTVILLFVVILLTVFMGRIIPLLPAKIPIAVVFLGIAVAFITFINPNAGLVVLILSMLLSPELTLAKLPERELSIRVDDVIVGIIFFSWLARIAVHKELGIFRHTPLNKPIAIYAGCCVLFTTLGMLRGNVRLVSGSFYIMKYLEYFLVYFMAVNLIRNEKHIKLYLVFLLITCGITCIYAASLIGKMERITAPFEGAGEPNTLGGYLLIMMALATGILLHQPSIRTKVSLFVLLAISSLCLAYTQSRASYMAFPFVYLTILFFSEKKGLIIGVLALVLVFFLIRPVVVIGRIKYTFNVPEPERRQAERIFGVAVESSAGARLSSWREAIRTIYVKHPIFGTGLVGYGFLDGQWVRNFIELGAVGFLAFIFLLVSIFNNFRVVYNKTPPGLYKGVALGGLGAFSGVVVHAITANSFMIIRIMEPFWFLAAMIMVMPTLESEESTLVSQ